MRYYIYFWFNDDWGGIPVYVGKGCKGRYRKISERSIAFTNHIKKWNCHSEIIFDDLSEDEAMRFESKIKKEFVLQGYPLIDAETSYRKKVTQSISIIKAKEMGSIFGRPKKQPSEFVSFLSMQRKGEITVEQACSKMGICKTTWYERLKEMPVQVII